MNYYVPNPHVEAPSNQRNTFDKSEPRYMPHILGRRFALTPTAYKFLDIGINVGPTSFVELILGDNRGNQIALPYATWTMIIERRKDIEQLLQSTASSSLSIRDLVIEVVKMRNENIIKLTLRDTCLYMKPSTVLFLLELELCVQHEYFKLCQNTHVVSERFNLFVYSVQGNPFTPKRDDVVKILREVYDKTSVIDCELLAYAVDKIMYEVLR